MNAHINRDLPDGIVQSFRALGGNPITDRTREQDFERVNDLLERVEHQVKTEFTVGAIAVVDRRQVLWGLGDVPFVRDRFFSKLDSLVGMTSRGLLLPVRS